MSVFGRKRTDAVDFLVRTPHFAALINSVEDVKKNNFLLMWISSFT